MTRPKPNDTAEKRQLEEALEEGLEETFPASDPRQCDPAAALEGGSPRQTEGLNAAGRVSPASIFKAFTKD
jgi:hypothetical protein